MVSVLSLPLVPFVRVLRNADLFTLLQFSMCSEVCKFGVQTGRLRVSKLEITCSEEPEITVNFNGNVYKLRVVRCEKSEEKLAETPNVLDVHFGRHEDGVRILCEKLLGLFQGDVTSVRFADEFRSVPMSSEWGRIRDCPSVTVEKSEISVEELEFLAQRHLDYLNLKNLPEDVKSFRFNARNLTVNDGRLLDRDSLLNVKSENILIMRSNFTTSDLSAFIQKWLEGDVTLKALSIYETQKDENVLGEIKAEPWDSQRRRRHFVKECGDSAILIDCRNGMDVERNDGTLATILTDHESEFHFFVWHHRFPEAPENAF